MTINVNFNRQSQQYSIEKDGKEVISFPEVYIQSKGNITASQMADAAEAIFNAPANSQWDIIEDHNRKKQAFYSKLGLFDASPEV